MLYVLHMYRGSGRCFTVAVDNVCVKSFHGIQQSTTGIDTQLTNDMHNIDMGRVRYNLIQQTHESSDFWFPGESNVHLLCYVPRTNLIVGSPSTKQYNI